MIPPVLPDRFATARLAFVPLSVADAPLIFDTYAQDFDVARYMTWSPQDACGNGSLRGRCPLVPFPYLVSREQRGVG
jgi:hypothetical protein